jgi:hypothetical protein
MAFTLLIIRQRYPRQWESLLGLGHANLLCRNVRESLEAVDGAYRNEVDINHKANRWIVAFG